MIISGNRGCPRFEVIRSNPGKMTAGGGGGFEVIRSNPGKWFNLLYPVEVAKKRCQRFEVIRDNPGRMTGG